MAKKKVNVEEYKDPNRLWSVEDGKEIYSFYKIATATREQMDRIYHFYKKYVKPNARQYITNCKCGSSISAYYKGLMDWYSNNANRFVD